MKACHVVVCVAEAVLFKNLGQEPGAIFSVKKSGPQSGIVTNLPWRHWVDCCVDPGGRGQEGWEGRSRAPLAAALQ